MHNIVGWLNVVYLANYNKLLSRGEVMASPTTVHARGLVHSNI